METKNNYENETTLVDIPLTLIRPNLKPVTVEWEDTEIINLTKSINTYTFSLVVGIIIGVMAVLSGMGLTFLIFGMTL